MASLRNIKDRITSIKSTQKITKAMKMVAAAKVRKAESAVKASRPFTFELYKMFNWVYKNAQNEQIDKIKTENSLENYSALFEKRDVKSVGIVVVSSNKGLAGAYCANVVRYALNLIKQYRSEGKKVCVYLVGQKAVAAMKNAQSRYGFEIKKVYANLLDGINATSSYIVAQNLANDFIAGDIDLIQLVTTRYKNMMTYITEHWQLLPVSSEIEKVKGFHNNELDVELNIVDNTDKIEPLSEAIPSITGVLLKILPMFVTNVIYQSLLEAQASELASRMTAMSAATNNAEEMISTLTVEYNKARQGKITQELTEILSGVNAVS